MANKEVPELDPASTLDGTEIVHVVQGGNSRRTTTGDLTTINGLTAKTTPDDADVLRLADSAASYVPKKVTWANMKAAIWSFIRGTYITAWTAYTPTYTGFGTVVTTSMFSRRVGDTLEIKGKFTCATATATEARMTIGSGLTVDSTKVPSIRHCGTVLRSFASSTQYHPLILGGDAYITFSRYDGSFDGLVSRVGTDLFASGNVVSVNASIPITGW